MSGTAKTAGLAVIAVLVAVVAGAATRPTVSAVAESVPSATPTPSVRVTPPAPTRKPVDPTKVATTNALYRTGRVPAVSCKLPKTLVQTRAGMLAYARVMVQCMQRAWRPAVLEAGFFLEVPWVEAYTLKTASATQLCRNPPEHTDGFYRSNTICFDWSSFVDADYPLWTQIDFQETIAHEFGHHLQSAVDILSTYEFAHAGASESVQLEDNRRMELQASCLGAAFLGAGKNTFRLTGDRFEIWKQQVTHTGDEYNPEKIRDHGSHKNHGYWSLRAFDSANPASCNTFTAPPKRVS